MKKATLIMVMFLAAACTKITPTPQQVIKSIVQTNNTVTAVFETTPGSKYSVQIVPFGSEKPAFKEGFTASDATTQKIYNLSTLTKSDYDLIFIDISGKEAKFPIVIK